MSAGGKLAGKVAIVTGAGAGIGRASSLLFAQEGARVAAVDRDATGLAELGEEVHRRGGSVETLEADVSSAEDVERAVQRTLAAWNRIDILFNNAGVVGGGKVHTLEEEEWDRTFAINVKGMFLFSRAVVPVFLRQGGGVILNTASTTIFRVPPDRALYSSTKGAILSLTKAMAIDYAADKIRVNCLCPGTTDTPSLRARLNTSLNPEEMTRKFIARQPLGRLGTEEEMAKAALYLVSDDAGFVTGSAFQIDGGMSL